MISWSNLTEEDLRAMTLLQLAEEYWSARGSVHGDSNDDPKLAEAIEVEFQRRDAELARLRSEVETLRQRCDVLEDQAFPGTRGLE